ncbi:aspartyl/lysyl-trna synthetase [Holotrichia oblita]|nr:aspartyl/lysyl-trna synthetase [Holotrichia oblita]
MEIKKILKDVKLINTDISADGWIKTSRSSGPITFIELNDGTVFDSLQVVLESSNLANYKEIVSLISGSAISVKGMLVTSPSGQGVELKASEVMILGACDNDYPLQKKRHSFEFLRDIAHLRPRTNTFRALYRLRSMLAFAFHQFYQSEGFIYLNSPIFTSNDAEGAGECFGVHVDGAEKDFFGQKTSLTVTGQLNAEAFALAFSKVYTFGPVFRADRSNTPRHASEFWMIEPEMAFTDLMGNINNIEKAIKYVIKYALENCAEEMAFFNKMIDNTLLERLNALVNAEFAIMAYTDAISYLAKAQEDGHQFSYNKIFWGMDLQSEHERYLCEVKINGPVFLINYPKEIKAFYMKLNDDNKTVAAVDLLVPRVGELVGGSQREDNYELLLKRLEDFHMHQEDLQWYLDLRRFGSCKHAGYGIGFDRFLMFITGIGEQTVLVNDYAFLGQHLALSQYQIDGQVTLEHQLSMRNVCSQSVPQDVAPLIDLTKLEDGDYVFSTTVGEEELFLSSELVISDSIILMPNLDGGRRTATIKALPENKTVVLSIRKYNGKVKRPDIVINPQGNPFFIGAGGLDELLKKANPHLKVVLTNVEEEQNMTRQLKDIAALEPVMAVSFASSLDLSVTIMDFDNTPAHPLIRELGGKVTGAISCEQGVANSCDLLRKEQNMKVLIIGGAGYIGSACANYFCQHNHEVVVLDDLSTGSKDFLIPSIKLIAHDARDKAFLTQLMSKEHFDGVILLAAKIKVVLAAMIATDTKNIIFSSTGSIYGNDVVVPIKEEAPLSPQSVYTETKLIAERILKWNEIFNLGREYPSSVLDIVKAFEAVGYPLKYRIGERRPLNADAVEQYASSEKAHRLLGWSAKMSLEEIIKSDIEFRKKLN